MEKFSQKRSLKDRAKEFLDLGGRSVEEYNAPVRQAMIRIRLLDDNIRSTLLGDSVGDGSVYGVTTSVNTLLDRAKSSYNRSDYALCISYLDQLVAKLVYIDKLIKDSPAINLTDLDKSYFSSLRRSKMAFYPENGIYKQAGFSDWLYATFTEQGRALKAWEKINSKAATKLREDLGKILSSTQSALSSILATLRDLSRLRANRNVAEYSESAKEINKTIANYFKKLQDDKFQDHKQQVLGILKQVAPPDANIPAGDALNEAANAAAQYSISPTGGVSATVLDPTTGNIVPASTPTTSTSPTGSVPSIVPAAPVLDFTVSDLVRYKGSDTSILAIIRKNDGTFKKGIVQEINNNLAKVRFGTRRAETIEINVNDLEKDVIASPSAPSVPTPAAPVVPAVPTPPAVPASTPVSPASVPPATAPTASPAAAPSASPAPKPAPKPTASSPASPAAAPAASPAASPATSPTAGSSPTATPAPVSTAPAAAAPTASPAVVPSATPIPADIFFEIGKEYVYIGNYRKIKGYTVNVKSIKNFSDGKRITFSYCENDDPFGKVLEITFKLDSLDTNLFNPVPSFAPVPTPTTATPASAPAPVPTPTSAPIPVSAASIDVDTLAKDTLLNYIGPANIDISNNYDVNKDFVYKGKSSAKPDMIIVDGYHNKDATYKRKAINKTDFINWFQVKPAAVVTPAVTSPPVYSTEFSTLKDGDIIELQAKPGQKFTVKMNGNRPTIEFNPSNFIQVLMPFKKISYLNNLNYLESLSEESDIIFSSFIKRYSNLIKQINPSTSIYLNKIANRLK